MSFEVISRLTGGLNLMPFLSLTVIVFWSLEICGSPSAMSGRGFSLSPGRRSTGSG